MPVDAFMYFNPSKSQGIIIEGESTDVHAGEKLKPFEIVSFEWGAYIGKKEVKTETLPDGTTSTTSVITPPTKSETTSHREVTVDNFKITKPFDTASLGLFMACTKPDCVFAEAVILFRKSGGDAPFIYLKFVFKEVRVDSVEWKIESADSDKPDQEDVKCSFQDCEMFYSPQKESGDKAISFSGGQKKTASYKRSVGAAKPP